MEVEFRVGNGKRCVVACIVDYYRLAGIFWWSEKFAVALVSFAADRVTQLKRSSSQSKLDFYSSARDTMFWKRKRKWSSGEDRGMTQGECVFCAATRK
jgi:hypothetical protein